MRIRHKGRKAHIVKTVYEPERKRGRDYVCAIIDPVEPPETALQPAAAWDKLTGSEKAKAFELVRDARLRYAAELMDQAHGIVTCHAADLEAGQVTFDAGTRAQIGRGVQAGRLLLTAGETQDAHSAA